MDQIRHINDIEKALLKYLVKRSSMQLPTDWDLNLFVQQMNDGRRESFLFFQDEPDLRINRKFGKQVSDFEFFDSN